MVNYYIMAIKDIDLTFIKVNFDINSFNQMVFNFKNYFKIKVKVYFKTNLVKLNNLDYFIAFIIEVFNFVIIIYFIEVSNFKNINLVKHFFMFLLLLTLIQDNFLNNLINFIKFEVIINITFFVNLT